MEEILRNATSVNFNFSGISSLLSIAAYVFSSLAFYTIAQRRGIRRAWLAWIPVVSVWILGSISDQYRYVVKGEVKSKRKILLVLSILTTIFSVIMIIQVFSVVFGVFMSIGNGMPEEQLLPVLAKGVLKSLAWSIPVLGLSIAQLVYGIMALYDVFTSCDPANNVLYLVLSIIPGINQITQPLFLFLCKDKDEGMPPRRETTVEF